ncbi:hypothetical protein BGP81_13810 [Pseudomonas putida]|nr:hypothetical protein BGP81_13810 [Pseudomonas putida]
MAGSARCNKCGSGLAPRSAARAALDLTGATTLEAYTLVREGDMEDDHKLLGSADYLLAMAKALMNDIELAKNKLH